MIPTGRPGAELGGQLGEPGAHAAEVLAGLGRPVGENAARDDGLCQEGQPSPSSEGTFEESYTEGEEEELVEEDDEQSLLQVGFANNWKILKAWQEGIDQPETEEAIGFIMWAEKLPSYGRECKALQLALDCYMRSQEWTDLQTEDVIIAEVQGKVEGCRLAAQSRLTEAMKAFGEQELSYRAQENGKTAEKAVREPGF